MFKKNYKYIIFIALLLFVLALPCFASTYKLYNCQFPGGASMNQEADFDLEISSVSLKGFWSINKIDYRDGDNWYTICVDGWYGPGPVDSDPWKNLEEFANTNEDGDYVGYGAYDGSYIFFSVLEHVLIHSYAPERGFSVAVILAEPNDVEHISSSISANPCKLLVEKNYTNGHSKEYYQDLLYCVADYHKENSFGTVNLGFTIYDNDGQWFKTDKNEQDYINNERDFVVDAMNSAESTGIDLSNYDMVVVLHSGTSAQKERDSLSTGTWPLDSQPLGYLPYKIIVAEDDLVGGWAHEVGHIIGALSTPQNTIIPDIYNMGNVDEWDLMAQGSWNEEGNNPSYMSSYTKEFLGWLNYDIYPKSAYGDYWINSLETSELGDNVFRYNLSDDVNDESEKYYILEVRNEDLKTWDSFLPGLSDKNLVLYYVDTKGLPKYGYNLEGMMWNQYRGINIPGKGSLNDGVLNTLINETYRDLDNLVKFSAITDRFDDDKYEIQTKIEQITNDSFIDRFWGVVLRPSSMFKNKIKKEPILSPSSSSDYALDYSDDSREVSVNNPCQSSRGYIIGRVENIFPATENVFFGDENFLGPNRSYEQFLNHRAAKDYRILKIKDSKSSPSRYFLLEKSVIDAWFIRKGDLIFLVYHSDANCESYAFNFLTFNIFKTVVFLLFIAIFIWSFIYYIKNIGLKEMVKIILRALFYLVVIIAVIFLIFMLLIYFNIIGPQVGAIYHKKIACNLFNPSAGQIISPDLDLHFYCDDGRHVGVNYETEEYEIQIPEAIVSGDNQNTPEWIFVPDSIAGCHYIVSSYDNQKFLEKNLEIAREIEDVRDVYEIYARYIDPESDIYTSNIISQEIGPGEGLEHEVDGTLDIIIGPGLSVEKIFEDIERGTKLIINTAEKTFHFIAPDKDLGIIKADRMDIVNDNQETILINYKSENINFTTTAITGDIDFCSASVRDKDGKEHYLLIDKTGRE